VLGLFTRPVAFILAGDMAVAYFMAHAPRGFFPLLNAGERGRPQYICSAYGSVAAGWLAVACLAALMLVLVAATIYATYLWGRQAAVAK